MVGSNDATAIATLARWSDSHYDTRNTKINQGEGKQKREIEIIDPNTNNNNQDAIIWQRGK